MRVVLVTGGARAGKSRWAQEEALRISADAVTFVATAQGRDEEMTRRIAQHRSERPAVWETVEEPHDVPRAVIQASRATVVLDCLTLWVSNLMLQDDAVASPDGQEIVEGRVHRAVEDLLDGVRDRDGTLFVVTNEVGLGVVPDNTLARSYRDLLGWANARIAREADQVIMMVAGLPLTVR